MPHARSVDSREQTVERVAVMLRDSTLSLACRQPLSMSLHLAVSRESVRLEVARRCDARQTPSGVQDR